MQVTELNTDGLKREFKVVVGSADIQSRVAGRLDEIARTASLPGFRPGKVPMPVLKKRFGPSVMGEVLEQTVNDTSFKAMEDRGLRPAAQPKIEITSFPEGGDLEFKMAVELLPEIKPMDFKTLKLERLKAEPADDEVQKAVERLAEARRTTAKIAEDRPAKAGDVVLIDFTGKIDGVEFAGGSAKDHRLELGSNQFVPGFEEQLVGHKAGETVDMKVTFPKDYAGEAVAGKDAVFTVPIKEIHEKAPLKIDEEFAKSIGFDDLDSLKKAAAEQIGRDYARVARTRLKRELLDKLSSAHDFPVPQGMVDNEFAGIKQNVDEARKRGDNDPLDRGQERRGHRQGVPPDRRAPHPPRPAAGRDRPPQQHRGDAGRGEPRAARGGAPLPRPGAQGDRVFPLPARGAGADPRPAVRGEGGRFHRRDGRHDREEGVDRGIDERTRGRAGQGLNKAARRAISQSHRGGKPRGEEP